LFVIIKSGFPPRWLNAPSSIKIDVVQVDEYGANIEDQVHDLIEEDDNNNIDQHSGTNELLQDLFASPVNDKDEDNAFIFYVRLLEKAMAALYEGSRTNILCYIISVELKGFEWFVKLLYDTDPKVCSMFPYYMFPRTYVGRRHRDSAG